ncbi:hypothetical protein EDD15DRAFT_1364346 [Pisolithus albus]|nr:hypothetical protein EDD15DRAFT_1364346 [Pisolithus albus]
MTTLPSMASIADKESTARCVCSCSKYNFGKPHTVSLATWYRHINEAETETEKQRIRSARVRQATPHLTRPVSVRGRAAIIQAMAKRRIETVEDVRHRMGRRKRARVQHGVSIVLRVSSALNLRYTIGRPLAHARSLPSCTRRQGKLYHRLHVCHTNVYCSICFRIRLTFLILH